MFWRWIPCGYLPWQIFFPILRIVLVFPWGFPLGVQMLLKLIQPHFLICGLFFIMLRGESIKNLLHFMSNCVLFSQEFDSIHHYISLEQELATHSSTLAWEFHGQRSLAGYSPWGRKELHMMEWLTHTHTHTHTYISLHLDIYTLWGLFCVWC